LKNRLALLDQSWSDFGIILPTDPRLSLSKAPHHFIRLCISPAWCSTRFCFGPSSALIATKDGVDLHYYSDDTQQYTSCSSADELTSATHLIQAFFPLLVI